MLEVLKIWIEKKEDLIPVQKELIRLGYDKRGKGFYFTNTKAIYCYSDGLIFKDSSNDTYYFRRHPNKEVTVEEIMDDGSF